MFTSEERSRLRSELLEYAANDSRMQAAAVTGSAAVDNEDRWSDIDLAFGVTDDAAVPNVLSDWTAYMYSRHGALHHVDIRAGAWIYRVFLLSSTLQVDLAFVATSEFRALAPTFRLLFGTAKDAQPAAPPQLASMAGLGWLYALHARSCIARGKVWQAEYMISGIRDNALALACAYHHLPTVHGRGIDQLPKSVSGLFEGSLIRELDGAELFRAFRAAVDGLLTVMREADPELTERLRETLLYLKEIPE
jgi:hypothetical protein